MSLYFPQVIQNLQAGGGGSTTNFSITGLGITGISVTGSGPIITGRINITGGGGTTTLLSGNTIVFVSSTVVGGVTNIAGLISTGDADNRYLKTVGDSSAYLSTGARLYMCSGSPEGLVTAMSGSICTDWFNATLYQKLTGVGAYGWS